MARRKKGLKIDGWINLDKPQGITSTQALGKLRRILNAQKAGHAGTLDPLATGVLPIALGEATKTISFAQDHKKTYRFTIHWGERRDTEDAEGQVIETCSHRPSVQKIEQALEEFIGPIGQIPPKFSAIKVNGERAYDLARDGEEFELKPRQVVIEKLALLNTFDDSAEFTMTCSKGTYVRSICRDLSEKLGTCGYISALKRTQVGPFDLSNAISLDKLAEIVDSAGALAEADAEILLPIETVLDDIPALAIRAEETVKLRNGQMLSFVSKPEFSRLTEIGYEAAPDKKSQALAIFQSKPVALLEIEGPQLKPVRVFNL